MRVIDLSFPIKSHFRWKVEPVLRSSHARGVDRAHHRLPRLYPRRRAGTLSAFTSTRSDLILDQFTRQAVPFATVAHRS